jgi:transcriptional regulator with XRE-family HTH domain
MPVFKRKATDRHIGERLRAARSEIGVSQTAVAEVLNVSFQQIQMYEKGINRIPASALFELSRFFEKPIGWFFPK